MSERIFTGIRKDGKIDRRTIVKGFLGKHHTEETKQKSREINQKLIGEIANHWKGGKTIIDGYVHIYSPDHPNKRKDKYVCEHRLIMEKKIGRYLDKKEVVHHIDGNRLNNNINNLKLYACSGDHSKTEHMIKDKKNGRFISKASL